MDSQPRLLFVHGSVVNAELTWSAQKPLAERFAIVAPNRRGFPPGPDVERVDFEDEAVWLEQFLEAEAGSVAGKAADARGADRGACGAARTHLVGHSYGGLIALLAAARRPGLVRSLTVIEPPAFGVARGVPAVDDLVARMEEHWTRGPRDPGEFLRGFFGLVGSSSPLGNFTPALLQGARTLMVERDPAQAVIPYAELAAAPWPKLAVSGGHSSAFEAVCDVLAERLGAERAVLSGAGHSVQRLGRPFNELLSDFVLRAEGAG
jgi:pimeloyl-ACP methyl ester carboxylesterase